MATAIDLDSHIRLDNAQKPPAPADPHLNPAALQAAADLLNRSYETGILDFLRALACSGDDLAGRIANGIDSPQTLRALKNGVVLMSILASIDPKLLERISTQFGSEAKRTAATGEPPSMWQNFRRLSHPDVRRGLAAVLDGLEAFGRAIANRRSE